MEFRILGSAPAFADPEKSQSCIWLEEEEVLLDCGEGTTAKLVKFNLLNKIKAVVISHFHPDHIIGLYTLLQNMHITKRKQPLFIYLPESIEMFKETLHLFYIDWKKFSFKCEFNPVEKLSKSFRIIPVSTTHLKKYSSITGRGNSFAFYLPESGFIYSSDINNLDFLKQVDNKGIIVLDGLHPEAEDIIQLGQDTEIRIILTHGLSQKLRKIISMTNRFEIADENKKYNFRRSSVASGRMQ